MTSSPEGEGGIKDDKACNVNFSVIFYKNPHLKYVWLQQKKE